MKRLIQIEPIVHASPILPGFKFAFTVFFLLFTNKHKRDERALGSGKKGDKTTLDKL